ncbi:hypothetical protein C8R45DRAFT_1222272 [Mycena sanguinolenta]|nr:hypothetical protein C8R45DRAFT_1222272 [Mycena sanguinolenta]
MPRRLPTHFPTTTGYRATSAKLAPIVSAYVIVPALQRSGASTLSSPSVSSLAKDDVVAGMCTIQHLFISHPLFDSIPTFAPDMSGVPALILTSIAVGAAFAPDGPTSLKAQHFPGAPIIPAIIVTPPPAEEIVTVKKDHTPDGSNIGLVRSVRLPLGSITNTLRILGKTARRPRSQEKENLKAHTNIPRLVHPRVDDLPPSPMSPMTFNIAEPASGEWDRQKALQLQQAKDWTDAVKARRLSLPTPSAASKSTPAKPIPHRVSLPARLPLAERLRLTVAGCAPSPPATPKVGVSSRSPLWGDDHASFVIGDEGEGDEEEASVDTLHLPDTNAAQVPPSNSMASASSGSISAILEAYESEFLSPLWLRLDQFAAGRDERGGMEQGSSGTGNVSEQSDSEEGYEDDHWSERPIIGLKFSIGTSQRTPSPLRLPPTSILCFGDTVEYPDNRHLAKDPRAVSWFPTVFLNGSAPDTLFSSPFLFLLRRRALQHRHRHTSSRTPSPL